MTLLMQWPQKTKKVFQLMSDMKPSKDVSVVFGQGGKTARIFVNPTSDVSKLGITLVNPDTEAVKNHPPEHWKLQGDKIVLLEESERKDVYSFPCIVETIKEVFVEVIKEVPIQTVREVKVEVIKEVRVEIPVLNVDLLVGFLLLEFLVLSCAAACFMGFK